jgi:hypothetical protein
LGTSLATDLKIPGVQEEKIFNARLIPIFEAEKSGVQHLRRAFRAATQILTPNFGPLNESDEPVLHSRERF